jgi:hypothetical protein
MKEYYYLNKDKVVYAIRLYLLGFGLLSAVTVAVMLIFFSIDLTIAIPGGLLATIILTAFLVLQALVTGNHEFERRKRVFRIPALHDFFKENDFALIQTMKESKWDFTELAMIGKVRGFFIIVDIDEDEPESVMFKFKTERILLNRNQLTNLLMIFNEYQARFDTEDIIMKIDFHKIGSTIYLKNKLESFAGFLYNEGFVPKN